MKLRVPYTALRLLMVTLLAVAFLLPVSLYILLSLPAVQENICRRVESELSRAVDMPVSIGKLSLSPFNRATLHDLALTDAQGDTAIFVKRLGAGINLRGLLSRRLVFNYAEVIGLDARIWRDSVGAPLNIQPLIEALKPKEPKREPTKFEFAISTVVIRTSAASYDIRNIPPKPDGMFDPAHIRVTDLSADALLPLMANDNFNVDLRRLALNEHCGLQLESLSGFFIFKDKQLSVNKLDIRLPHSELLFGDIALDTSALGDAQKRRNIPIDLQILNPSHIATADLAPLLRTPANIDLTVAVDAKVSGTPSHLSIAMQLDDRTNESSIAIDALAENLDRGIDKASFDISRANISAHGAKIAALLRSTINLPTNTATIISNLGDTDLSAQYTGDINAGNLKMEFSAAPGYINVDGAFDRTASKNITLRGNLVTDRFDCSRLFESTGNALADFGATSLEADFDLTLIPNNPQGHIDLSVPYIKYRGHEYTDITAMADIEGQEYVGRINVDNPGILLNIDVEANNSPANRMLNFTIDADHVDLRALNITQKTDGRTIRLQGEGMLYGRDIDHTNGHIYLRNIAFVDNQGKGLRLDEFSVETTSTEDGSKEITMLSDIFDGSLTGNFSFTSLPKVAKSIVENVFPNIIGASADRLTELASTDHADILNFNVQIKNTRPLEGLVSLPVKIIHPVDINGSLNSRTHAISLNVEAPYLQQGNKIIEATSLRSGLYGNPGSTGRANLYATSLIPTKNGPMTVAASAFGSDGQLDSQISWHIKREHRYTGDINLSTHFARSNTGALNTTVRINPSDVVINDTIWSVRPAKVEIHDHVVDVADFLVTRPGQRISINGRASANPTDTMTLSLTDIDLDYIFETLGIETAMFGGRATGDFYIKSAFTSNPIAYTPQLKVKGLKYNYSLMGDADIKSSWDNRAKAINIDARIEQANGGVSYIDGRILPTKDSLDFTFDADRISIGFLKPFMAAFATKVSGYATGKARLWGTFKLVDMVGDIYGEDVAITLGFTNTTYTTTDTVRLTPGRIDLSDLTIHDKYGNTAKLNGWLRHKFFKEPSFSFNISDARNLLVYDIAEAPNERWYGTVYGNGFASVDGHPGYVKIGVDVTTAPKSTFTFVISDAMQASDYNFITFRDRDMARKDSLANIHDSTPEAVVNLKQTLAQKDQDSSPSIYDMNIKVDVNPNALVTLVMDPVGGDKIVTRGNGNMRMTYDSANEDLRMFGKYTLERGSYNFTLQDIIIKDFTIENGSSITFNGNPYAAQLDIKAVYALNANLSDLDESFLQDKELNRTNVPVHALLLVSGDMRQPDIQYDLEFPSLSSDIYRKVRSIINTEEMMSRQIIYLLVLNRFYTPEYMSATKGNELVSVASSTISSQLTNILGQLSDKLSIAPNFRSDRGDFSDMEVDVALSSHLLNNRLLLNGNLGYRDKALNNNSFIGDFDIEYLLNRQGTLRLKAYNHYNDQNYYLKSALTTQGVGVVLKRDFDNMFSFLRPWLRKSSKKKSEAPDSIKHPTDTIMGDGR